ncbi:MAG: hypothetical protein CM15mP62_22200 [Rhodospirillaceae bacterium]|nr:MAG: hypothetical protein CM15mP62_22200 [Rhodospirillaceae bacterium]
MKKSDSESVVQIEFYTSVILYYLFMLGIEVIIVRFLKTNCIPLKCTFDYFVVFGVFELFKVNYLNKLPLH